MSITMSTPEREAPRVPPRRDADASEYSSFEAVLEKLASSPVPEEVLAIRLSESLEQRLDELLVKSRESGFTPAEQREWDRYAEAEHLVNMAKIKATIQLQSERS